MKAKDSRKMTRCNVNVSYLQQMPSLLCMENITGVEETQVKGSKCIKISTNIRDNRDHILRADVSYSPCS